MTTTLAPAQPAVSEISEEDQLVVVVAERHIAAGERGSAWKCPVALALKEAGYQDAWVCSTHLHAGKYTYEPPASLADWIADFDAGRAVNPERWVIRSTAASN